MTYTPYVANDILTFASIRALVEPVVNTTLGTVVSPGINTVIPLSMAGIYQGAQLIVGTGADVEIVVVTSVTATTFTANFAFSHLSTDPVYAATFATGQPDNILFTQTEMLSYLSEAMDDFTLKTRPMYNIAAAGFTAGVRAYQAPNDALRIERISRVDYGQLGTIIPAPGTYTVFPASLKGISNGSNVLVGITGTNFEVVVASNVTSTSFDATFVDTHAASDPIYPAGILRLWDVSVSDLDRQIPGWQGQQGTPKMYYEDQLNVGQYGVYKLPGVSFPSNVWYSQRNTQIFGSLGLLAPMLIPDPLVYIPYYGMLARVFRKDGEMRDPQREQYCQRRYDVGVEIVTRLLEGISVGVNPGPVQES